MFAFPLTIGCIRAIALPVRARSVDVVGGAVPFLQAIALGMAVPVAVNRHKVFVIVDRQDPGVTLTQWPYPAAGAGDGAAWGFRWRVCSIVIVSAPSHVSEASLQLFSPGLTPGYLVAPSFMLAYFGYRWVSHRPTPTAGQPRCHRADVFTEDALHIVIYYCLVNSGCLICVK